MGQPFDPTCGMCRANFAPDRIEVVSGGERNSVARRWKAQAQKVAHEVDVIWLVFKDPRTPWYARVVAAFAVGYVFSPIQLIPSFIPVIGFFDDFVVLAAGFKVVRALAGADVMRDCRERATVSREPSKGETRRLARFAAVLVAGLWLLGTVAGTMWLYR